MKNHKDMETSMVNIFVCFKHDAINDVKDKYSNVIQSMMQDINVRT